MSFYANIATTAAALISDKGTTFAFKRTSGQVIDPVTGAVTAGTTVTTTARGIYKAVRHDQIDGTLIQQGDKMLILDNSFTPILTDTVLIDSVEWNVVGVEPIAPAGIPVIYSVHVRR